MASSPEIVFRLAGRRAALQLHQVREVILPGALIRVPRAAPAVLGAMNVRGRVVLIVDAGLLLGAEGARQGAHTERILVLDPRRRDLGLWVSEVQQIAQLGEEQPPSLAFPEQLALDAERLAQLVADLFTSPSPKPGSEAAAVEKNISTTGSHDTR